MSYRSYDPIRALHAVTHRDLFGGVNPPVIDSVTFDQDPILLEQCFAGRFGPEDDLYIYARIAHPNTEFLGCQISAMEDAEWTAVVSSGQAAMSTVINALTPMRGSVVASSRLYGGTLKSLESLRSSRGIDVRYVDITDHAAVLAHVAGAHPTLLIAESVSNPSVVTADIAALAEIAHAHGALLLVDNTFMPLLTLPLRLGADIVVHSLTKYISGKSDGIAGSISLSRSGNATNKAKIRSAITFSGPVLHHAYAQVLSKRMSDLPLRVAAASANALAVAREFSRRSYKVYYPGLGEYRHKASFAKNLFTKKYGYGGVVAVDLGSTEAAIEFVRKMKRGEFGYSAVSLGSSHTYACAPVASVSSGTAGPEELTPSLVRLAIGYECHKDLILEEITKAL